MTWGWRLLALGLFIIAMVVLSKTYWALITNGYGWLVALATIGFIVVSFWIDKRRARAAAD